ncbi:hypothetical protein P7C70_g1583, partial [Phenoliferia sp. Uapishka_3]
MLPKDGTEARTTLLDLPVEALQIICEEAREDPSQPALVDCQIDLQRLRAVNRSFRVLTLPSLWKYIQLTQHELGHNGTLKILLLDLRIFSFVRYVEIDVDVFDTLDGENSIAFALALASVATNLRGVYTYGTLGGGDRVLPTTFTNALKTSKIEELHLRSVTGFDDDTFGVSKVTSLKELWLWSPTLIRQMVDGGAPLSLSTVELKGVFDGNIAGEVLLWALDKIVHLRLELSQAPGGRPNIFWTHHLLERLNQSLTRSAPTIRLKSICFRDVGNFFSRNESDVGTPTSASIFEILAKIPINSLKLICCGDLHWTTALAHIQLTALTTLTLRATWRKRQGSEVDDVRSPQPFL